MSPSPDTDELSGLPQPRTFAHFHSRTLTLTLTRALVQAHTGDRAPA
ncbi:hypothetical protein [Streptomyces sp. NPDC058964]